jgi:dTDP-glucose 4,6-dehydratase
MFPDISNSEWLDFASGDVLHPTSLPRIPGITHVLHAASDSTLGPALSPLQQFDQIVNGTRNILDLTISLGASHFLLCSSGGVYGSFPSGVTCIDEAHMGIPDPLEPANAYGIGKRAAEHLCAVYARQFDLHVVIARCFAFVGQDLPLDAHFAIGNFIRDALVKPSIVVNGDGSPIRSYMDQRDLARWLVSILEHGERGRAYNVGSDHPITIRDLAALVRDLLAPHKPVKILSAEHKSSGARNIYVPSVNLARDKLQLHMNFKLDESIVETAKHVAGSSFMH